MRARPTFAASLGIAVPTGVTRDLRRLWLIGAVGVIGVLWYLAAKR